MPNDIEITVSEGNTQSAKVLVDGVEIKQLNSVVLKLLPNTRPELVLTMDTTNLIVKVDGAHKETRFEGLAQLDKEDRELLRAALRVID